MTGNDCVTNPDGSVAIITPRLGQAGAVRVSALTRYVLDAARTRLDPENVASPAVVDIVGPGGTKNVIFGHISFGRFRVCDLAPSAGPPTSPSGPTGVTDTRFNTDFLPRETNCATIPALKVNKDNPTSGFAPRVTLDDKVAGMELDVLGGSDLGGQDTFLGVDDERGGRVFGTLALKLPVNLIGARVVRVGLSVEVSRDARFRARSLTFDLQPLGGLGLARVPTGIPGVSLRDVRVNIDPSQDRFAARAQVAIPGGFQVLGDFAIRGGDVERLGASATFNPGLALTPPPVAIFLNRIGAAYQAPVERSFPLLDQPARLQGSLGFVAGPTIRLPVGSFRALTGDVTLTIAGPTIALTGDIFAINRIVKLASARVLVRTSPFRFEGQARVTYLGFIRGDVFLGLTSSAFTALGKVSLCTPDGIPLIGGKCFGGAEAALSNVGAGGVVKVSLPLLPDPTAGVGFRYQPFDAFAITSLDRFVTVRPTASAALASARTLQLPRRLRAVLIEIRGSRRPPRSVRLVGPRGRVRLEAVRALSGGRSATFLLRQASAGRYRVTSPDPIRQVNFLRPGGFPYLDPSPGFGSRPRRPVIAGRPARVCWRVKHAPRRAVVDLFEDQNGRLGTGRSIALGRPRRGCFNVPTAGLEPGKHWVYGVVRAGSHTISARYWPIAIEVVDPAAPPAPTDVRVTATGDGATVTFTGSDDFAAYEVIAEPEAQGTGIEPQLAAVPAGGPQSTELSLRGTDSWTIRVRAVAANGARGNLSAPLRARPLSPLVLAGEAGDPAQARQPWLLQLRTSRGLRVRVVRGPPGLRVSRRGLVSWRPRAATAKAPPAEAVLEACAPDGRCLERQLFVGVLARGTAPAGPPRGFKVTPNVVRRSTRGRTIVLHVQGVDQRVVVRINGRRVRARRGGEGEVLVRLPRLGRGSHDVSLRIGRDLTETRPRALLVR